MAQRPPIPTRPLPPTPLRETGAPGAPGPSPKGAPSPSGAQPYAPFASATATWDVIGTRGKQARFWAFFKTDSWSAVAPVYACPDAAGTDTVGGLLTSKTHSIEHVVPRSTLARLLPPDTPDDVRRGAALDPFNWLPARRNANSARGAREYDTDDDAIVRRSGAGCLGVDADGEWVVPAASRGDVARATLYMHAAYRLPVAASRAAAFLHWHHIDPPSAYERAYAAWVRAQPLYAGLAQPLIEHPLETDALWRTLAPLVRADAARTPKAPHAACIACLLNVHEATD